MAPAAMKPMPSDEKTLEGAGVFSRAQFFRPGHLHVLAYHAVHVNMKTYSTLSLRVQDEGQSDMPCTWGIRMQDADLCPRHRMAVFKQCGRMRAMFAI